MAGSSGNPNQPGGRPPQAGKGRKPPVRRPASPPSPQVAHPAPVMPEPAHAVPPVAAPQAAPGPAGPSVLNTIAADARAHPHVRRPSPFSQPGVVIGGGVAAICVVGLLIYLMSSGGTPELKLKKIAPQTVNELATLDFIVPAEPAGGLEGGLAFSISEGPDGAEIDAKTGRFRWTPTERQGPGEHSVVVCVSSVASPELKTKRKFVVQVDEVNQPPEVEPIEPQWVEPGAALVLTVKARDPDDPPRDLRYRLVEGGQTGAEVDPQTGRFEWMPRSLSRGAVERFAVQVEEVGGRGNAKVEFSAGLKPTTGPVDDLLADLRTRGARVEALEEELRTPLPGTCETLSINGQKVGIYRYESDSEAKQQAGELPAEVLKRFGTAADGKPKARIYQGGPLVAFYAGEDNTVREYLVVCVGDPVALAVADDNPFEVVDPMPAGPEERPEPETPATVPAGQGDEQLLALREDGKLCVRKEYPKLRKIFADRFEAEQAAVIQQAFGDDKQMGAWLDEHAEIKEELYTAIDPQHDNVVRALQLFRELKTQYPEKIVPFAELAIAVAVTWDNDRAVYDYAHHQRRTRSNLPDGMLGALENFEYLTTADRITQAYGQFLPWEFLVHVINHRTPAPERQWAAANYGNRRMKFGQCYKDVPYDTVMLETGGKTVKLEGKDYTLSNIRQLGGVCAMQADFASRAGKSLGIPAAYVGGEAAGGELHAWVMWVELKGVPTKTSVPFTLESFGRYRGDKYYVGTLRDPQTGQGTTDRALELRLQTVGLGKESKRQADLVMAAYPMLREKTEMDVTDQLVFLNKVIELSPGNEAAWIAISKMSRDGVVDKSHHRAMQGTLKRLFTTFAHFPDFTWKIFDDLVAYMDVPKQRNKYYGDLVNLYVKAGRPDLACEAVLKCSDYLVEEEDTKEAIGILSMTIMAFPDEGRYVPALLDKLEATCEGIDGSEPQLLAFYRQFLPRVPKARGDRVSPFWMRMCERAIDRFRQAGDEAGAKAIEGELAKVQKK